MLVCEICAAEFPLVVVIDGKPRHLRGRKRCLDCRPFRPLRGPRRSVHRGVKVLICGACGREFFAKQVVDGKMRSLYRRKFCLECSPFGIHNTSKVPLRHRTSEEWQRGRRERRLASFKRSLQKRRRKRKLDLVLAHGGRCVDCGYAASLEALQFHHRDPSKKDFRLGEFNGSRARLFEEAAKCDLVCANCHRLRHSIEAKGSAARVVVLRRETKLRAVALFGDICTGCGGSHPPAVFDFHHLDAGAKEFGISTEGIYRSWDRIAAELAKCVMLCANCHAEVHAGVRVLGGTPQTPAEPEQLPVAVSGAA